MIEDLYINPHLIPSYISFFTGGALLVITAVLYQIRTKTVIILNPIKAWREYSRLEKRIFCAGVFFALFGLISLIVISETVGYYYIKNGVPTLLKK